MKKNRKILVYLTLFIIALTSLRLYWLFVVTPPEPAHAIHGELDLREWDFESGRAISLNGEWAFYPNQLLTNSASIDKEKQPPMQMLNVPGNWNHVFGNDKNPTFGYGSYRLLIQVKADEDRIYGIHLPTTPASSKIIVNGRVIAQAGEPGASADSYKPRIAPYSGTFSSGEEEIEIIVQVANFNDRIAGGIYWPIKFGSDQAVHKTTWFSAGLQLSVCLVLLGHAIYSAILYGMGIRQKALVYFFLLLLIAIVSILIDNSYLLIAWLPISYEWNLKLYYLSYLGMAVLILRYTISLLPEISHIWGLRAYTAISAVYAAAIPFLPVEWLTYTDYIHVPLVMISFLAVPVVAYMAVLKGNKDVIFILLGISAITVNSIWGIVKNTGWMEMGFYPFDMIAAFIAFGSYWFKRYLRSSAQTAKLAEKLLDEDKRKDQFLVQTSHELRNPLHGMLAIAQTILSGDERVDDAKNRDNMGLLLSVGKRMSYLLNDLLDISRLKEKQVRLELKAVSVQAVAAGVCDMIRLMTAGKPVELVNRIPDELPVVLADENRLVQILFNLLHNAAKFTDEGIITVDARIKDGQAVITVTDTGIGMNEEQLRKAFEPYEQGVDGNIAYASGLGLGLGICKQLIELHEGEITVSSKRGFGSVFTFTLPLFNAAIDEEKPSVIPLPVQAMLRETAAAFAKPVNAPQAGGSVSRLHLLVVDDDPINLSVMRNVLSHEGFEVVTATSGKEALNQLTAVEWDLIITDVMMPNMSGYQLTQAVRQRFEVTELPILLLTARSRPEDIEMGFQSGANDYLTKPIDVLELKSRVRALTDIRKSFKERLRVEAAWLQAQIQPHFLFNTLNAIGALSEIDTNRMMSLLNEFGDYLRASFDPRNLERVVVLEHELKLVRSYLHIEKERFEERLQVHWEIDENLTLELPPLSIQPLVENAVKHGILKRARGGSLYIRIKGYADYTEVVIEDDGIGIEDNRLNSLLTGEAAEGQGIGLRNTDRRLNQLYGRGLQLESIVGQGTKISFVIPRSG
ncbi:ATP-binding protein [Paenibacillus sp. 2TAB23]|uniref:hybrid sensor histidine kinase/response regulator n=1 Tax=Paenibacillus sp. 2TAB23 TaxID=3233004 RepID=UPI003F95E451